MLAVGLQSQQGKLASAIRSITMLASGCFGSGSWHSVLKPVINGITRYGFPAGAVLWAVSLLTGTAASLLPVEALFYWPCNMPKACARELMAKCFHFIPSGKTDAFVPITIICKHCTTCAWGWSKPLLDFMPHGQAHMRCACPT